MTAFAHDALPGFAALRTKFMTILEGAQADIASHAMDAWNAETSAGKTTSLAAARAILHKIAGSAGSFGLKDVGAAASACEAMIDTHLDAPASDRQPCPSDILIAIDDFVSRCEPYLDAA
jgi:hypothetical protein